MKWITYPTYLLQHWWPTSLGSLMVSISQKRLMTKDWPHLSILYSTRQLLILPIWVMSYRSRMTKSPENLHTALCTVCNANLSWNTTHHLEIFKFAQTLFKCFTWLGFAKRFKIWPIGSWSSGLTYIVTYGLLGCWYGLVKCWMYDVVD